jgi:hypothetical protein
MQVPSAAAAAAAAAAVMLHMVLIIIYQGDSAGHCSFLWNHVVHASASV